MPLTDTEIQIIGTLDPVQPVLVFLHEGLGSVSAWRDFPGRLCEATGLAGILYSRHGYGWSAPFSKPLATDFMHVAAREELRGLIERFDLQAPVLIGHSDGASIALIYSGEFAGQPGAPVASVLMAPHLFVEPVCLHAIHALQRGYAENLPLQESLARHHRNAQQTFDAWSSAWLSDDFRQWDIRNICRQVTAPVLAIQGEDDQYGTMAQLDQLQALAPQSQLLKLSRCGHSPHRDQASRVTEAITSFLNDVRSQLG